MSRLLPDAEAEISSPTVALLWLSFRSRKATTAPIHTLSNVLNHHTERYMIWDS
jgi:hypothetical protein